MPAKNKNAKGMDLKKVEDDLKKFWKGTKDYLKKATDESSTLIKKGEEHFRTFSEKSKLALEVLILKTKQEGLYNKLGKVVSKSTKSSLKKSNALRKQISDISKEVASRKRKIKTL